MERPILFSAPMVRAILDGHKTQTRRVIDKDVSNRFDIDTDGTAFAYIDQATGDSYKPHDICIYKPGDILWVKEAWATYWRHNTDGYIYPCEFEGQIDIDKFMSEDIGYPFALGKAGGIEYRASYPENGYGYYGAGPFVGRITKWRSLRYMPKWAARIWLKVKDVRVERVQDISEDDARAEGCITFSDKIGDGKFDDVYEFDLTARDAFVELWDSINAKRGYGWGINPWVWAIEFEVAEAQP